MAREATTRNLRRAALAALAVGVLTLQGCRASTPGGGPATPQAASPPPAAEELPLGAPRWGSLVRKVSVRGARRVEQALILDQMRTRPGSTLVREAVAEDLRRLHALEVFSDIRIEARPDGAGSELVVSVVERRPLARVVVIGLPIAEDSADPFLPRAGDPYDPRQIWRVARGIERTLREAGHLDAVVRERSAEMQADPVVTFDVKPGPRFVLERIEFVGNSALSDARLLQEVDTHEATANAPGKTPRPDLMEVDLLRLVSLYMDHGHINARAAPPELVRDTERGRVVLRVRIDEGPVFQLGRVEISGSPIAPASTYRRLLGVKPGETFSRGKLHDGLERLRALHRDKGKDTLDVRPESEVDLEARRVHLKLVVTKP